MQHPYLIAGTLALSTVFLFSAHRPIAAEQYAVQVSHIYARVSGGIGKTGAVFGTFENHANHPDRLISVESDIAKRVGIHTHVELEGGIFSMRPLSEGLSLPAGGTAILARGGDHIMLMGLTQTLSDGATFPLTLNFEKAGAIEVTVTIENSRSN